MGEKIVSASYKSIKKNTELQLLQLKHLVPSLAFDSLNKWLYVNHYTFINVLKQIFLEYLKN